MIFIKLSVYCYQHFTLIIVYWGHDGTLSAKVTALCKSCQSFFAAAGCCYFRLSVYPFEYLILAMIGQFLPEFWPFVNWVRFCGHNSSFSFQLLFRQIFRARGYKKNFMLNLAEHGISYAHMYKNINSAFFRLRYPSNAIFSARIY